MSRLKAKKFHEMQDYELVNQLKDLKTEFFNLRFQQATGQHSNTKSIKEVKKDIARVKTIIRERELKEAAK